ncbi:MAG: hypothetical protein ACRDZ9_03590, partial [Acidimicrobiales bacterium]
GSARAAARQAVEAATGPPGDPGGGAPPPTPPPASRPTLGAVRGGARAEGAPVPAPDPAGADPSPGAPLPGRDELTLAWADHVLGRLRPVARGLFGAGRFVRTDDTAAELALPTDALRRKCDARRGEVEAVLAAHFGRPVPLRLVLDAPSTTSTADGGAPGTDAGEEAVDLAELRDAPALPGAGVDHLTSAFPGAEVVEE